MQNLTLLDILHGDYEYQTLSSETHVRSVVSSLLYIELISYVQRYL